MSLPKPPRYQIIVAALKGDTNALNEMYLWFQAIYQRVITTASFTWASLDKTGSSLADLESKSHNSLTSKGTNTHAQIDTALSSMVQTSSGVYTPTAANNVNCAIPTVYPAQWLRVGNTVTVSGKFNADPSRATSLTANAKFTLSLPVASDFANDYECCGTAHSKGKEGASIYADTVNNLMVVEWKAVNVSSQDMTYQATYRVI